MKMVRLYDKENLIGYRYNNVLIEIEYEFNGNKGIYGVTKKWYHCDALKEIGKASCFDKLKECKEFIDNYLLKEMK